MPWRDGVRQAFAVSLALLSHGLTLVVAQEPITRVSGSVIDASTGERLARVRLRLDGNAREGVTNDKGEFAFDDLSAGEHTLVAETVGYRLHRETVTTSADQPTEVTIALVPDAVRLTETVTVTGDPFQPTIPASPSENRLGATEIRNLGSVLFDDPMRSMSTLPGVTAPDDNRSSFAVRGAPFQRIAFYLDDVPVRALTHSFGAGVGDGFSISLLNDQVLNSMTLLSVAPPPAYGGATGAAVVAETRDGSREKPAFHASISLLDTNLLGEGPLTSSNNGSWFVTFRRSNFVFDKGSNQNGGTSSESLVFTDGQARVSYNLTPTNTVSIHALAGSNRFATTDSHLTKEGFEGPNTVAASTGSTELVKANWRSTPIPTVVVSTSAAYETVRDDAHSPTNDLLAWSRYRDASGQTRLSWFWRANASLRAGYEADRSTETGTSYLSLAENPVFRSANAYDGRAITQSAYAEQNWTSGRFHLTGGARWQWNDRVGGHTFLPFASTTVDLNANSKFELGWGQYAQFPEIEMIELATAGGLAPQRSTHYIAAFEHKLDAQTRVRIEAYDRQDSDILDAPDVYPRLVGGVVTWPATLPRFKNAYDGYSRGIQLLVQRRSASRLTGWVGYTIGFNRERDLATNTWFDSDTDTRQAVNLYLAYRLTPSINLSGRYNIASGAPLPGYFKFVDADVEGPDSQVIVAQRNTSRLPDYQRLDLRLNKSFVYTRWKMTLYGEVLNATDRKNYRFMGVTGNFPNRAWINLGNAIPLFPAVGLSVDF